MVSTLTIRFILLLLTTFGVAPLQGRPAQKTDPTTRSPHGALDMPCQNCHTFSGWKPIRSVPEFDHNKTRYPLRGLHKNVACVQCHTNAVFNNVGNKCADCHADIHRRQMGAQCEQCHSVNGWAISLKSIREHQNRFPLIGAHAVADCESCHKGAAVGQYKGLSTDCIGCHMNSYLSTKSPSHTALGFPTQCQQCHTTMDSWAGARFDHAAMTGFALTGAHATLDCTTCHVGGKYQGTPTNCIGCHTKDYNGAKDPNHVSLGFPQACSQCHSTTTWLGAKFDHARTGFVLTGAHATLNCSSCHTGATLTAANTTCVSCHLNDFNKTTNPNHAAGGFSQQCNTCHTTTAWQPAMFDHSKTIFPLTGAHTTVACTNCHVGGKYTGTSTACSACHMTEFQKTTNPNHTVVAFPTTCQTCHSTTDWLSATFNHATTGFALTGAHTTQACSSCHAGTPLTAANAACSSCHLNDFNKTTNPNHVTGGFSQQCVTCHTTTAWQPAMFDHSKTVFPLTGAHTTLACTNCHVGGKYAGTPTACSSCHMSTYQKTTNPNHTVVAFPTTCSTCHSTTDWLSATFNHATTGFALTGAHTTQACSSCHAGTPLTAANAACSSCHLNDFNKTTNPNHVTGGFSQQCNTCHTTTAWQPAMFDHSKTIFPLTGAHTTLACTNCHVGGKYAGTPTACSSCHITEYQKTTNPNHTVVAFPTTCSTCHSTTDWLSAKFDHSTTGWALTGAHLTQACSSCHAGVPLTAANTACSSCHLPTYQKTTNPNHTVVAFPTTCQTCHSTTDWLSAKFDHSTTGWALTGAHITQPCSSCHAGTPLTAANTACSSCHLATYQKTTNPNHTVVAFPTTCSTCHSTTDWLSATFNHATTGFALTGAHTTQACSSCHAGTPLTAANAACSSCHMSKYQKTTNPNHTVVAFPTTCQTCHSTTDWLSATFNHATTGFALTGAHATQACSSCHAGTPLTAANAACSSCHISTYQKTTNPNHIAVGFPTDCSLCHGTTNWLGAKFDHSTTGWALSGAHTTLNCSSCHGAVMLTAANTACVSCHLKNYNSTTNPNHVTAAFPQQCNVCHTTIAWQPATFDHSKTVFPLTGAHTSVACANCHIGGKYAGTPTDCYSCHKAVYTATTNPNHVAAGFPTTCVTCHTTTTWTGATFNHTWFKIPHHAAQLCGDCHTNPSNYTVFLCTNCHTQAKTTSQHSGVKGFVWNSTNCYSCHKN